MLGSHVFSGYETGSEFKYLLKSDNYFLITVHIDVSEV